jgi:hypothetical protein
VKRGRTVIGVEADKYELEAWGRAAQLRRQDLDVWVKKALSEAATRDEQRSAPVAHPQSRPAS